jgi:hypothetical protein
MDRPSPHRPRPTALLLAALIAAATLATACKPGDGASGVNPPSGTRQPDQAPRQQ